MRGKDSYQLAVISWQMAVTTWEGCDNRRCEVCGLRFKLLIFFLYLVPIFYLVRPAGFEPAACGFEVRRLTC